MAEHARLDIRVYPRTLCGLRFAILTRGQTKEKSSQELIGFDLLHSTQFQKSDLHPCHDVLLDCLLPDQQERLCFPVRCRKGPRAHLQSVIYVELLLKVRKNLQTLSDCC